MASSIHNRSNEEINQCLIKLLPELDSKYAKYPMTFKKWKQLGDKGPNGEPMYLKNHNQNSGIKKNYVFGKGPGGPAYYHLLTKNAYINLYTRISSMCPATCGCACNKEARDAMDEWDCVKRVIQARYQSRVPDDKGATQQQLQVAKNTAQAIYHYDQNTQLVHAAVSYANQPGK
jgi:hypothetical protein